MTQETPTKVLSLLGVAVASMFFLFAVSVSNASFAGMENPIPDPFAAVKVMSVLDNAANSYSSFAQANFISQVQQDYAVYADNVNFLAQEVGSVINQYTGRAGVNLKPHVAGSSSQIVSTEYYPPQTGGISVDSLYALLIR